MLNKIILALLLMLSQLALSQNTIEGKIYNAKNNIPLDGANLYFPELKKGAVSDENGYFVIKNLPDGNYRIQVTYLGFQPVVKTIQPGEAEPIEIKLNPIVIHAEEIIVSSGSYTTQHQNAIRIESLDAEQIANNGQPTLVGNLQQTPGVDIISKGSGISKPVIRGLSNSNVIFLNDGVKLENFQFSENHPYLFDDSDAGKVEIIKGPASLLYGSDAVGGLINILNQHPAPVGALEGMVRQEYFSASKGLNSKILLKGSDEKFYWMAGGSFKTHKDYESGTGTTVPNSRFNHSGISATAGLNTSSGNYELVYDYFSPQSGMTVSGVENLIEEGERSNQVWYQDLSNHLVSLKGKTFFGSSKLNTRVSYQSNHRQLTTNGTTPVDMTMNNLSYDLKYHFPAKGEDIYIVGFQGAFKENKNGDAPNRVLPNHTVTDFALYGMIQYPLTEKLHVQAGVRGDARTIDIPGQEASGHSHEEEKHEEEEEHEELLEAFNESYQNLSGSAGFTYRFTETLLLRSNLSLGYRTPNSAEISQDGIHSTRFERGNKNLKSQRNYEADINLHYHCCHLMFDVAAFYNRVNDYIFLDGTGETVEEEGTVYPLYQYRQQDATLQGVEAGFETNILQWLNVKASYAGLRGKLINDENLPFIPHNKARMFLTAEGEKLGFIAKPKVRVSGLHAFRQEHPSEFETSSEAYTVVDLMASARLMIGHHALDFGVSVLNLFDEAYIDHLSTLKPMGYAATGRNIRVWLQIPIGK